MSPSQKRRRRGFEYSPLQSNSFRLLELIPGQSLSADIHCRLQDYQLDLAPPYEAFSCTWGDKKSMCRISLNDLSFHIRPNLGNVLRRLRQSSSTRILWIDAICINQSNEDEKSIQVPLTGNIYTRAEQAIAWLGEETVESGVALDFIPELTKIAKIDDESTWLSHLDDDKFLRRLISLYHLFIHPWWQRMWIVQEVALVPDVLVLCGSRHVRWSIFHYFTIAWMIIEHMPQEHRLKKLQIIAVRALGIYVSSFAEALTRLRQQHQNIFFTPVLLKLSNLPWSFKDRSATDRRDKIYGLLGLLGDHGVQVDYGKPSEDIYLSFSSSFLLEDKGLDLFRWVTGEDYESKNPRLPSWVPDFGPRSIRPISSFLPNQYIGESQRIFMIAGPDRSR